MNVNTNIPALKILNQLNKTNSALDKTLERLSSGKRINRAADDAAGLAISQKMHTQIRGLDIANRNSMDGISLIQTAEGALMEVHSMLQRMRELSIQASNGTLSLEDKATINSEVDQLKDEINRISNNTEYNGIKLLNGNVDRKAFSSDSEAANVLYMSDTVDAAKYKFSISQEATKTKDIGGAVSLFNEDGRALIEGKISINGEQVEINRGDSTEEVFSKIRNLANTVGISMTTTPPFENGKRITLESNNYGPTEILVAGDYQLLTALGLDENSFDPSSTKLYEASNAAGFTTPAAGSVYINGVEVAFSAGDNNATIFEKIKEAGIPDVNVSLESGSIKIISNKPIMIDPKSDTDETLATALKTALSDTAAEVIDYAASKSGREIDTETTLASSDVKIMIDGVQVGANINVPAGQLDIDSLITTLNGIDADTTFYVENGKLTAYNANGYKVSIDPVNDVLDASTALGFTESDVGLQTVHGNKGKNVEIDMTSIVFDNVNTLENEGFPLGTTIKTEGKKIIFEGPNKFELVMESGERVGNVKVNILESGPLTLQIGANEGQFMNVRIQNLSVAALGLEDVNMSTAELAQSSISKLDNAIFTISSVRSKLGAFQNRLEHTVSSLTVASENMTASLSRIEDADMAAEMAEYTQKNVLSQAAISILAQANQRPQGILQLLNG